MAGVSARRADSDKNIITDINDPRNGFTLEKSLHTHEKDLAFLPVSRLPDSSIFHCAVPYLTPNCQTPNPVLNRADIRPLPNTTGAVNGRSITVHKINREALYPTIAPLFLASANHDLVSLQGEQSAFDSDPPDWILHFMYGVRVVAEWGTQDTADYLKDIAKRFYPDGMPPKERTAETKDADLHARLLRQQQREERKRDSDDLSEDEALDGMIAFCLTTVDVRAREERKAKRSQIAEWLSTVPGVTD